MFQNKKKNLTAASYAPEPETAPARIFIEGFRPYLWLLLLIAAVYGQTLGFGYTNYDDDQLILNNQGFIKDLSNLGQAFRQDVLSNPKGLFYYRPLLTLSFMLDAQLGGTGPFVYHLTNLMLHLLTCWLLFILLSKLTGQEEKSFYAVLIFAVHPILSQAVAWIPGRNDSLLAVFLLGALVAFIRHWEGGKWFWFAVSQLLFLASMFTKETAVVFPLICLAYTYLLGNPGIKKRRTLILNLAGWALCILLWYLLREYAMTLSGAWRGFKFFTASEAAIGMFSYFLKLALPVNLSVIPDLRNLQWSGGLIVLILAAVLAFWLGFRTKKLALFGMSWTILFLLPVLTIVPGPKAFLEHRMYLPLMGLLLLLVSMDLKKIPASLQKILLAAVVISFSGSSFVHSRAFKNDLTCWRNAVDTSPGSDIARNGLGKAYYQRGQVAEAGRQFILALEQDPQNPVYLYNTAALYLTRENVDSADIYITKELSLYPEYPKANFIKARICQIKGDYPAAEKHYLMELDNNPRYMKAYTGLVQLYLEQDKNGQARDLVLKALRLYPQDRELRQMLSVIP